MSAYRFLDLLMNLVVRVCSSFCHRNADYQQRIYMWHYKLKIENLHRRFTYLFLWCALNESNIQFLSRYWKHDYFLAKMQQKKNEIQRIDTVMQNMQQAFLPSSTSFVINIGCLFIGDASMSRFYLAHQMIFISFSTKCMKHLRKIFLRFFFLLHLATVAHEVCRAMKKLQ